MTQEEKQLLLNDLCARLPYGFTVHRYSDNRDITFGENELDEFSHFLEYSEGKEFKPYFRPMSSMTEEEKKEYHRQVDIDLDRTAEVLREQFEAGTFHPENKFTPQYCHIDWLNAHHFDYRGLIPMGLALEATKETYE